MKYSFTGPSKLNDRDRELLVLAVARLEDGTEFTTGGAAGWDMAVARVAAERWPDAYHRIVLPAAPCCRPEAFSLYRRGLVDEVIELPPSPGIGASAPSLAEEYRARNERLVDFGGVLVAAVRGLRFYRSGEHMTVNIARGRFVPVRFVDLLSGDLVLADGSSWA